MAWEMSIPRTKINRTVLKDKGFPDHVRCMHYFGNPGALGFKMGIYLKLCICVHTFHIYIIYIYIYIKYIYFDI